MKYLSLVLFTAFSFLNVTSAQTPPDNIAPPTCQQWFDGCNNCGRGEVGGPLRCTAMACMENQEPKCLRFFGEEPLTPPTNIPDNSVTSKNLGGLTKTTIPDNCQQWFDGCNNCSVGEDGEPMACTLKWCDQDEEPKCLKFFDEEPTKEEPAKEAPKVVEKAPDNCQQWFDGCNNCHRGNIGGPLGCTRMACAQNEEPKCLKFFEEDEVPEETTPEPEVKKDFEVLTFKVAPQKQPCVGVAPQQCYVVNGKIFYDEIEGFTFEEGIAYTLKVLKDLAFEGEVPADASMYSYTLLQVLEKSDPNEIKEFTDIDDKNDFAKAIKKLQSDKIIKGYTDGTYKPSNRINRAEFLTLLMRATGEEFTGKNCFNDVTNQWFAPAVCTAKEMGIIEGYQGGNFEPARRINIAEASKIINKILKISVDDSLQGIWYEKFLKALEEKKALPDTIFAADQEISRGEMAEIVWRVRDNVTDKPTQNYETISSDLPQFGSCDLFGEQLKKSKINQPQYYDEMMFMKSDTMMPRTTSAMPMATMESESAGSDNYSETNVQVAGVDEADIVKTDGEYLYYLRDRKIDIIKAYPPENMEKRSTIELPKNFSAREIMIRNDQLILLGNSNSQINYDEYQINNGEIQAMPAIWPSRGGYHRQKTGILIYDLEDKSHPKKVENITFDGNYQTVRRIDNQLYLVTTENIWNYEIQPMELLPAFQRNGAAEQKLVDCESVRYIPGHNLRQYTSFIALDLDNLEQKPKQEVIFGGNSGSVYLSPNNAYITTPFYQSGRFTDWNWQNDRQQTILFKFSLNDGDIKFEKKGRVTGSLLNQFSMDENDGYFRVATTTQGNELNNHVFVLDPQMEIVGTINDIAPGEKIYSTRFIGDRLYMVTFRTIDPLFVIDLSSPSNPKILGKLKIPGYSNYLHPFDENHLIGFGKDTTESKDQSRAWYQGMKVALFDVSDVKNPTQRHQIIIGDRGTQSELLNNHKALMWDDQRKIIGFPIQVAKISDEQKANDKEGNAWGRTEFNGAHAYKVSLDKGFELVAAISHYSDEDLLKMGDYFPQDYQKNIQRMLYIDDTFYTLSQKKVKATDIISGQDIKTITLQDEDSEKYYPTPIPMPLEEPKVLESPISVGSETCSDFRFGNCPDSCQSVCTPSSCTKDACTSDCDGPGSCVKKNIIPVEPDGGIGDGAESLDDLLDQ